MKVNQLDDIRNIENALDITDLIPKEKINKKIQIFRNFVKRFIDIVVSVIGVICLIPLTIVIYILRKILKEDGPLFYEQLRIGKDGKHFRIYKFRTMVVGADEKLKKYLEENEDAKREYEEKHKLKDDPRITKLGKFLRQTSLDETPQFLNVLKGDMSLIGPRPYLIKERDNMGEYFTTITSIKPGITGFWQVSGRSNVTFKDRLEMDRNYCNNSSLLLDTKLLLKTFLKVIEKDGAK